MAPRGSAKTAASSNGGKSFEIIRASWSVITSFVVAFIGIGVLYAEVDQVKEDASEASRAIRAIPLIQKDIENLTKTTERLAESIEASARDRLELERLIGQSNQKVDTLVDVLRRMEEDRRKKE